MTDQKPTPHDPAGFQRPDRPFLIEPENLSEAQRALVARMEAGPRGTVPINQRIWMHNMPFADVAERFGSYVSAQAPMGAREKEICILVVAAFWDSDFEWHWHQALALKKGIAPAQIAAIRAGTDPGFEAPSEQLTFEIVAALLRQRDIPDSLYRRATETLGRDAILDLIGLMGLYTMIAQTIKLYDLQIPASG